MTANDAVLVRIGWCTCSHELGYWARNNMTFVLHHKGCNLVPLRIKGEHRRQRQNIGMRKPSIAHYDPKIHRQQPLSSLVDLQDYPYDSCSCHLAQVMSEGSKCG